MADGWNHTPDGEREDPEDGLSNGVYCDTLCWTCTAPGTNRCDWDAFARPVEGWKAEPTVIRMDTGGERISVDSFRVIECPLYRPSKNACLHSHRLL